MSATGKVTRARKARDKALAELEYHKRVAESYKQELSRVRSEWEYHVDYMNDVLPKYSAAYKPEVREFGGVPPRVVPAMSEPTSSYDLSAPIPLRAAFSDIELNSIRVALDQRERPNEVIHDIHFISTYSEDMYYSHSASLDQLRDRHYLRFVIDDLCNYAKRMFFKNIGRQSKK